MIGRRSFVTRPGLLPASADSVVVVDCCFVARRVAGCVGSEGRRFGDGSVFADGWTSFGVSTVVDARVRELA